MSLIYINPKPLKRRQEKRSVFPIRASLLCSLSLSLSLSLPRFSMSSFTSSSARGVVGGEEGRRRKRRKRKKGLFLVRVEEEEETEDETDDVFEFATRRTRGRVRLFRAADDGKDEENEEEERPPRSSSKSSSNNTAKVVLVPFIPRSFSVADVCAFFAPVRANATEVRVILPASNKNVEKKKNANTNTTNNTNNNYFAALLAFRDAPSATMFAKNFDGQPFSNVNDEEICRCLFVKSISFGKDEEDNEDDDDDDSDDEETNYTELPANCPVCLDRLDGEVSGVVTTSCGHHFHSECMSGVSGSVCPVCRFALDDATAKREAKCERCECANGSLWTCLICGVVGCGRYENRHAVQHWTETGHCYCLEIGSGRVWDYSRDQFVHRLIQGKHGLVELTPDEKGRMRVGRVEGPGGGEGGHTNGYSDAGGSHEDDDPQLTEALVASKLDAVANEYDQLLASQLDEQRQHYEKLLMDAVSDKTEMMTKVELVAEQATKLRSLNRRADHAEKEVKRLEEENVFLKQLNEQMLRDAGDMRETKMESLTKEKEKIASLEEKVKELESVNRDLMFFLESKDTIQKSKGSELDARFGKIELEEKEEMHEEPTLIRGKVSTKDRLRAKLKERNKK